jgi:hypothetical protein
MAGGDHARVFGFERDREDACGAMPKEMKHVGSTCNASRTRAICPISRRFSKPSFAASDSRGRSGMHWMRDHRFTRFTRWPSHDWRNVTFKKDIDNYSVVYEIDVGAAK